MTPDQREASLRLADQIENEGMADDVICTLQAAALLRELAAEPDETSAELALRSLACWLGVGGYNAPAPIKAAEFEQKIRDGVDMMSEGARALAQQVLSLDVVTPRGLQAKAKARAVLGIAGAAQEPQAEPVQEPVAEVGDLIFDVRDRAMKAGHLNRDPLYAYPPQCQHFRHKAWPHNKWNPLTDGDALRLAVKLEIDLQFSAAYVRAFCRVDRKIAAESVDGVDPYAATRRAIVRAAAEIGKEKT